MSMIARCDSGFDYFMGYSCATPMPSFPDMRISCGEAENGNGYSSCEDSAGSILFSATLSGLAENPPVDSVSFGTAVLGESMMLSSPKART